MSDLEWPMEDVDERHQDLIFDDGYGYKDENGNSIRHREGGPVIECYHLQDFEVCYFNGLQHKIDGPSVKMVGEDMCEEWMLNGVLHRTDGPARMVGQDFIYWFFNGVFHRKDGPAIITMRDGRLNREEWYQYGVRHRTNGPAVITEGGYVEWWLKGENVHGREGLYPTCKPRSSLIERVKKFFGLNS